MGSILRGSGPLVCVVGARPNYMKMAPLVRAFAQTPGLPSAMLIHTGQHYDVEMNARLFADLGLPPPDLNLEVGSATHAVQTAEIMRRFDPIVEEMKPACVIVVGDVNSTLACTLVAVKRGVPVAHVEAGLRSFDRQMPEEINRLLTDQVADLLYTTEPDAEANLVREGVDGSRIHFVGNVMIDCLRQHLPRAITPAATLQAAGLSCKALDGAEGYGVVTLHRPSNVDTRDALGDVLEMLRNVSLRLPFAWPLHPRTRDNIARFGFEEFLQTARIVLLPPQGYLEMLGLLAGARVVLTDSGGIQEETTALAVPCLTVRDNTERPVTVSQGTNTLVGRNPAAVARALDDIFATGGKRGRVPEGWDGRAAPRIASHLASWLASRHPAAERVGIG